MKTQKVMQPGFRAGYLLKEMFESLTAISPKVFVNIRRHGKVIPFKRGGFFTRDSEGNIKDSLIIKGDNLFVLASLLHEFRGRIKCIYIDPPYNTGNTDFVYHDNYEHSLWLSFMRRRLLMAKEFLRDDGVIFVQIDNSPNVHGESPELGYLLVLMDEVFGRRNYVTTITWKKKSNPGNTGRLIGTVTESILVYAKDKSKVSFNLQRYDREYKYEDEKGKYNLERPLKTDNGVYKRDTMKYEVVDPKTGKVYRPPKGMRWTIGKRKMLQLLDEGKVVFKNGILYIKKYEKDYKRGNAKLYSNLLLDHGSLKTAKTELEKLGFGRESFPSPKPEILIKTLLDMVISSNEDIVMDFFAGSGTTCAVVHKMRLQYIGVEYMPYVKDIVVKRLKKVIEGEQGGISKEVGWNGGGSFVYMELLEIAQKLKESLRGSNYGKFFEKARELCSGIEILFTERCHMSSNQPDSNWILHKLPCYVDLSKIRRVSYLSKKDFVRNNDFYRDLMWCALPIFSVLETKNQKSISLQEFAYDRLHKGEKSGHYFITGVSEAFNARAIGF